MAYCDPDADRVFDTPPAERLRAFRERMMEPRPLRPRSRAEWQQRRQQLRERLREALGLLPMPERLPLEMERVLLAEREGCRLERLRWQTWPGVRASGRLALPSPAPTAMPAILLSCGHAGADPSDPTVHAALIALARKGCAALVLDPVHLYDYSVGLTPLTVMVYGALRALDCLSALAGAGRRQLGVAGIRDGIEAALLLLALDERPRAALLAGDVGYYRDTVPEEPPGCLCGVLPGALRFTDRPELCGMAAPRALLLLVPDARADAFAARELLELRALYRLLGQPDRLEHRLLPPDSRALADLLAAWFDIRLRGEGGAGMPDAEARAEVPHPAADTGADSAAQPGAPDEEGTAGILEWYRRHAVAQPPALEGRAARRNYQERVRAELLERLGGDPPPVCLDAVEAGSGRLTLRTEPDVRIPAIWLPTSGDGGRPVFIPLHPQGKAAALRSVLARAFRGAGYSILAPDLRFRGEMRREWLHLTLLWGRPEAGMAAHDLRVCVDWLLGREETDPTAVVVHGEGDMGLVALLAAALDERIVAVTADCCETTYRDGGDGLPLIPNVLRTADVPQIASLIAPRPLWLYRVPQERVGFASRRYYDWTRRTYQSLGEPEALRMTVGGAPDPAALLPWLQQRLRRAARR